MMSYTDVSHQQLLTPQLTATLRHARRRRALNAFGLVLPLLLFIVVTFVVPIGHMLVRSVYAPVVGQTLPKSATLLRQWNGVDTLPPELFPIFSDELVTARTHRVLGKIGNRLNYTHSGMSSLLKKTARTLQANGAAHSLHELAAVDRRWNEREPWSALRQASFSWTSRFYLNGVDHAISPDGKIVRQPVERRLYLSLFGRTLWIGALVTTLCLILGYPLAAMLAGLSERRANVLLILVLLPFWTSLLVRTTAWIAILQTEGVLNDVLVYLHIVDPMQRPQLIHNATGTIIAMTHILLPFMILPLYSVMKSIPGSLVRAALSLGAPPTTAFLRIYLPLSLPGVGAGSLLVFILATGYYITPALVGGPTGQLISNMVAYHMQQSLNWGLASALSGLLLVAILLLYWLYNRLIGIDKLRFN